MKIVTATEIKHLENSLEFLQEFEIELVLDNILAKEFELGLPSDINNAF